MATLFDQITEGTESPLLRSMRELARMARHIETAIAAGAALDPDFMRDNADLAAEIESAHTQCADIWRESRALYPVPVCRNLVFTTAIACLAAQS